MLDMLKYIQESPFPLVQVFVKPRKAMPCCGGQEQASKLQANIEYGATGASLTIFVTHCRP